MIAPPRIDVRIIHNKELTSILSILDRYALELTIFDLRTDLQIPVYAAVLLDTTGKGPAVSLGLKAGFDTIRAIIGAIEEALMTRTWIRDKYIYQKKEFDMPKKIETIDQRAYFWFKPEKIKYFSFLFNGEKMNKPKLKDTVKIRKDLETNIVYFSGLVFTANQVFIQRRCRKTA